MNCYLQREYLSKKYIAFRLHFILLNKLKKIHKISIFELSKDFSFLYNDQIHICQDNVISFYDVLSNAIYIIESRCLHVSKYNSTKKLIRLYFANGFGLHPAISSQTIIDIQIPFVLVAATYSIAHIIYKYLHSTSEKLIFNFI
jgi:hypothetical protein